MNNLKPEIQNTPLVSVIVLNYNGANLLLDCLRSLKEQDWSNLEIIVADNASRDNSKEVAESYGARFHQMDENYGYCYTFNRSVEEVAHGEFIFFVNNDTRFHPSCLSRLMRVLLSDGTLFMAEVKELEWEGERIIHHAQRFAKGSFFRHAIIPWIRFTGFDALVEVPFSSSAGMLVRRSMFETLGGFDDTFFLDFEGEICWRAWLRGWRTVYVPDAYVYHKLGATYKGGRRHNTKIDPVLKRRISYVKNYLRFIIKTMPLDIVCLVLVREVLRIIGHALIDDPIVARIRLRALTHTIITFPSILKARRETLAPAVTTSRALIRKFLEPAVPERFRD